MRKKLLIPSKKICRKMQEKQQRILKFLLIKNWNLQG
nr:MAG TPA: hypothetical protein [Caudoviricetes sp.]